jgi:hypothetical protein
MFLAVLALVAFPTASVAAPDTGAAAPQVALYPSFNQALNVLVPGGNSSGGTVHFLGSFNSTPQCQAACAQSVERCWSFVHFPEASPVPPPGPTTAYKIRVKRSHLQLQADDMADGFISTRYQTDDNYSRFLLGSVSSSNTTVHIRVVADDKVLTANDGSSQDGELPPHIVSTATAPTKSGKDSTFVLEPAPDRQSYAIRTAADPPRYWTVEPLGNPRGGIFTAPARPGGPAAQTQFVIEPAQGTPSSKHSGRPGDCYAVVSPGFNPSWDPNAG